MLCGKLQLFPKSSPDPTGNPYSPVAMNHVIQNTKLNHLKPPFNIDYTARLMPGARISLASRLVGSWPLSLSKNPELECSELFGKHMHGP